MSTKTEETLTSAQLQELVIKEKVADCEKEIERCKEVFAEMHKKLTDAETDLITAREIKRLAEEELYVWQSTKIGENSLDDWFDWQVADYKERMPSLLKKLEGEKPLPYKAISDLETIAEWPKTRREKEDEKNRGGK